MTGYTTGTGHYVLKDADGEVIAKCAHHAIGTHRVSDHAGPNECHDLDGPDELDQYQVAEEYRPSR